MTAGNPFSFLVSHRTMYSEIEPIFTNCDSLGADFDHLDVSQIGVRANVDLFSVTVQQGKPSIKLGNRHPKFCAQTSVLRRTSSRRLLTSKPGNSTCTSKKKIIVQQASSNSLLCHGRKSLLSTEFSSLTGDEIRYRPKNILAQCKPFHLCWSESCSSSFQFVPPFLG